VGAYTFFRSITVLRRLMKLLMIRLSPSLFEALSFFGVLAESAWYLEQAIDDATNEVSTSILRSYCCSILSNSHL
jgi:hypothetical protein